jgi:hypothetical protein
MKIPIVILRVIRRQSLHGPGYLQQRFAPRSPAGGNLFLQQIVQFQIYLGKLISASFCQLSDDLLRAHFSLFPTAYK